MVDVETGRFTVGVFQDLAWAEKGLAALKQAGFVPESLTILAKESPEVAALLTRTLGRSAAIVSSCPASAPVLTRGPLVDALQGPDARPREARHRRDDAPRRISVA